MGYYANESDYDDDDFEYDEFEEEEREYRRAVRKRRATFLLISGAWILVSVAVVSGIYITTGSSIQDWLSGAFDMGIRRSANPDGLPVVSFFTGKKGPRLSKFELGRARFGMTPKMIERNISDVHWATSRTEDRVAVYHMEDARYEVWFMPGKKRNQAFRIQYEKTFPAHSESRIFRHLKKRLGPTIENTCGQGLIISERQCHATWMHSGGVYIKATSTLVKRKSGGYAIRMKMVAIDTFLDRNPFRPRISSRDRSAAARPSEVLPFDEAAIPNDRLMGFEQALRVRGLLNYSD
jgi:hypothetical protein